MKTCTKCNIIKDIADFYLSSGKRKDKYRACCKECCKIQDKELYRKYKDKITSRHMLYYNNNKEKLSLKQKAYAAAHRKEKSQKDSARYIKNKDAINKRNNLHYVNNKDIYFDIARRRRARKRAVAESYTSCCKECTMIAFSYKCFNCNSREDLCIDHYYPLCDGNPLTMNNAVVLCNSCNGRKGTRNPEDFFEGGKWMLAEELMKKANEILLGVA